VIASPQRPRTKSAIIVDDASHWEEIGGTRHRCTVPHWTFIGVIGLIVGDRFITSAG